MRILAFVDHLSLSTAKGALRQGLVAKMALHTWIKIADVEHGVVHQAIGSDMRLLENVAVGNGHFNDKY